MADSQLIPPGFLSLFEIKNNGKNPGDILSTVQPGLDMVEWFFNANAELISGDASFISGTLGLQSIDNAQLQVPTNQWWYVHGVTLRVFGSTGGDELIAGESASVAPAFVYSVVTDAITPYLILDTGNSLATAFVGPIRGCAVGYSDKPHWLPPLARIQAYFSNWVTGGANMNIRAMARITRVKV